VVGETRIWWKSLISSSASKLSMKRLAIPIISILLVASLVHAADDVKTAKVLGVKTYDRGRIAFWEGRVPIYDGYPFL
jgi:hypothetical protein